MTAQDRQAQRRARQDTTRARKPGEVARIFRAGLRRTLKRMAVDLLLALAVLAALLWDAIRLTAGF